MWGAGFRDEFLRRGAHFYLCLSSWVTARNQIFYVVDLGGRVIYFGVGLSELVRVGDFNRGVVEQFGAI